MPLHDQADLASALLNETPRMRAYAWLMTNDRSGADGAVEETLKSVSANDTKWCGDASQLRISLITILRGKVLCGLLAGDRPAFHQGFRDAYGTFCNSFAAIGRAISANHTVTSVGAALLRLSIADREAMILSAATGFPDVEIAKICGCAPETVTERVKRGRAQLAELLRVEFVDGVTPITVPAAALGVGDAKIMAAVR
jgi:DNA-directed RNA polymerase specialized sigma24 family protein